MREENGDLLRSGVKLRLTSDLTLILRMAQETKAVSLECKIRRLLPSLSYAPCNKTRKHLGNDVAMLGQF